MVVSRYMVGTSISLTLLILLARLFLKLTEIQGKVNELSVGVNCVEATYNEFETNLLI